MESYAIIYPRNIYSAFTLGLYGKIKGFVCQHKNLYLDQQSVSGLQLKKSMQG